MAVRIDNYPVVVVGGGSAAFEWAVAAKQSGAARVVMLEKAPEPAVSLTVPLVVDARAATNWDDAH